MAAAEAAILLQLEPFGRLLLVLLRVVVPALALTARQDDHDSVLFFCHERTLRGLSHTLKKRTSGSVLEASSYHGPTSGRKVKNRSKAAKRPGKPCVAKYRRSKGRCSMNLRTVSFFLGLGGLLASPALAAGSNSAIMVPVAGAVAAVNADNGAKLNSYFMPKATVVDEFSPFIWSGPNVAAVWLHDLDQANARTGITELHATMLGITHVDITGDHAYVEAPLDISWHYKGKIQRETGLWVFTLYHTGGVWKITTVSWAAQKTT